MDTEPERPWGQKDDLSALNAAIGATNRAEKISFIAPAKAVFGTVGILLTLIRVCFILFCNDLFQPHI